MGRDLKIFSIRIIPHLYSYERTRGDLVITNQMQKKINLLSRPTTSSSNLFYYLASILATLVSALGGLANRRAISLCSSSTRFPVRCLRFFGRQTSVYWPHRAAGWPRCLGLLLLRARLCVASGHSSPLEYVSTYFLATLLGKKTKKCTSKMANDCDKGDITNPKNIVKLTKFDQLLEDLHKELEARYAADLKAILDSCSVDWWGVATEFKEMAYGSTSSTLADEVNSDVSTFEPPLTQADIAKILQDQNTVSDNNFLTAINMLHVLIG